MDGYISSAIETIYENEDDYIVIGLTGRTGSGCSTVAGILQGSAAEIRHSLYNGDEPTSNSQRKEKIIVRHFEKSWTPFHLVQVRSVITLLLIDCGLELALDFLRKKAVPAEKVKVAENILSDLLAKYHSAATLSDPSEVIKFYTQTLPKISDEIKVALGEPIVVPLYQAIGKNIRLSGLPFDETMRKGQFFSLISRVHKIIRIIIACNLKLKVKSLIVVDALRNPLEAIFLQDKITGFHLVAVSCPNEQRLTRLAAQNFSLQDIESIDAIEYANRDLEIESTYSMQDIQGCLQRADIYISNPDGENAVGQLVPLTNQIIRLISLIKRPGIVTPTALERCMQIAYTAKLNSGCISRQVGALVTDSNFSVKAVGWNDTPQGQVPCNLRNREHLIHGSDQSAYSNFEKNDKKYLNHFVERSKKYIKIAESGRNISYCFKSEFNSIDGKSNQVHTRSLHAEENAFLQISKYGGQGVQGGFLFTTASPCELCAKKAYQIGISKIFYIDPYPGISLSHIIEGGTANPFMELFSGAIGRSFHKLYSPIMAYKDELHALAMDNNV